MAPKQVPPLPVAQPKATPAKAAPPPPPDGAAQKSAAAKKQKTASRKKKKRTIEVQDWNDTLPPMEERQKEAVTTKSTVEKLVKKVIENSHGNKRGLDPAKMDRKWKFHLAVTGIENLTADHWEIFIAASMGHTKRPLKHKLREKFSYTRSYKVKPSVKKHCSSQEEIYNMAWKGSYIDCKTTDVCLDVWAVSRENFNSIVGSARRTFYDMGNNNVHQRVPIISSENGKRTLGYIYISALLDEVMWFKIEASNWQFVPSKGVKNNINSVKNLRIQTPSGSGQAGLTFTTDPVSGPRYLWPHSGVFTYEGTKASLAMEAMKISVDSDGKLQGKAIISMCTIGEYPIVVGNVKKLGGLGQPVSFIQGRVGGSLVVTSKSLLLKDQDQVQEEATSIPPPIQPASSLVAFYLSPIMQYLIVDVWSADGLPVADLDFGSSNPFVRVKYDGMVQQSEPQMSTLHPVFNHTFYLPILVTDERIRTNADYYKRLLPKEMKSKQYLEIEIWHWDNVPSDFLGGMKLDPYFVHHEGVPMERSIVKKVKKAKWNADDAQNEEDDDVELGLSGALAKKHKTKVYQGRREKLEGSSLQQSHLKATVSFDACFVKPFHPMFVFERQAEDDPLKEHQSPFETSFAKWDHTWPRFLQAYSAWFPDGPKEDQRRYLRIYQDNSGDPVPLPRLISPLALPSSLGTPLDVQHWVRCMEFTVPPSQRSSGQIQRWQDPHSMLALRRGSIQDHAVILCCALIGLGKDAFVCKGTVQGGKEHVWVMTREQQGIVTFWETTTATRIHMASRWQGDARIKGQAAGKKVVAERWQKRKKGLKEDWQDQTAMRKNKTRDELMSTMGDLKLLPISPWKELYHESKVVAVPYESIEILFNSFQLWGNLGNHHPTCIYYDMEDDPKSWQPLIMEGQLITLAEGQGLAIPVGPAISESARENLQKTFEAEIRDCIRIMRMRRGTDTVFEEGTAFRQELREALTKIVHFLEAESRLDFDWCFDPEGKLRRPWGAWSPFDSTHYVQRCKDSWRAYWKGRGELIKKRTELPVKENHFLSGVPLHFSCTDLREIRFHILNSPPLQEYLSISDDEPIFFVVSNIVPMPASVASVWIFVGVEVPLSRETIREGLLKEREEMNKRMWFGAGIKEEDSDNEKPHSPKKRKKKKGDWFQEEIA